VSNSGPRYRLTSAMSTHPEGGLIALIRRHAAETDPTADCLDDLQVAAVVDGALDPVLRPQVLSHLAGCARCRRIVASVARAVAVPAVQIPTRSRRRLPGRIAWIALPAAAAAALLLYLRPAAGPTALPHRGGNDDTAAVPLTPIGVVADPRLLVWSTRPGADRYRVTVYDDSARVVFMREQADTVLRLDDSIRIDAGRHYLWKVEARLGLDRWSGSRVVEFSPSPRSR